MRQVIGVGNPVRGDDAAGLEAAGRLRRLAPRDVRVVQYEGETSRLLDLWTEADEAILVDAAHSGARPGTVHRFDARAGPLTKVRLRSTSTHAVGIAEAVELARALDRLPARLVVYAVEGGSFETGAPLTPAVSEGVQRVVEEVCATLREGDA